MVTAATPMLVLLACLQVQHSQVTLGENTKLKRGLNFVSVCLTLGASLVSLSPSELWVDGQEIKPCVKVLSGPFYMTAEGQLVPSNSCHASVCSILATSPESSFVQHISDPKPMYTTTLAIEWKCKQTDLPQNIILGHLWPMQEEDTEVFEDAAENTASVLTESWMSWSSGQQVLSPSSNLQPSFDFISSTQTWKVSEQQQELAATGLDSSVLSPFTESINEFNEHDSEFVPQITTSLRCLSTNILIAKVPKNFLLSRMNYSACSR